MCVGEWHNYRTLRTLFYSTAQLLYAQPNPPLLSLRLILMPMSMGILLPRGTPDSAAVDGIRPKLSNSWADLARPVARAKEALLVQGHRQPLRLN